jgi:hypothetical protein
MDTEITPPVEGAEREAILRAVTELVPPTAPPRSAWWGRGVDENVAADVEDPRAV